MTAPECPAAVSEEDLEAHRLVALVLYGGLGATICGLGIAGNALNLAVLRRVQSRPAAIYIYLTALAVADLLTLLTVLPYVVLQLTPPSLLPACGGAAVIVTGWFLAFYTARCFNPLCNACIYCSVYVTFWITVDRFVAVRHPLKYAADCRRNWRERDARHRVALSAVMAVVVNAPAVFFYREVRAGGGWSVELHPAEMRSSWWLLVVVMQQALLLVPVAAILVMNAMVVARMRKLKRRPGVPPDDPFTSPASVPATVPSVSVLATETEAATCPPAPCPAGRRSRRRTSSREDAERRLVSLLVAISVTSATFNMAASAAILLMLAPGAEHDSIAVFIMKAASNDLQFGACLLDVVLYYMFSLEMRRAFVALARDVVRALGRCCHASASKDLPARSATSPMVPTASLTSLPARLSAP